MAGDGQTGMMIMKMDQGLDTGPVALTCNVAIEPDMTAGELHDRLMAAGAELMVDALARLEQGDLPLTPQAADGVTYASKIDKAETRIDWSRPAGEVHDHIRGLAPFPGAWCEMAMGDKAERLKILRTTLERRASNWTHKGRSNTLIEHRNIPKTDSTFRSDALADGEGAPGEVLDDRLAVACGDGAVRLLQVQRAGGKAVSADEFLRGAKLDAGVKLA
jgi:methionyl-tRNA formyltransferase